MRQRAHLEPSSAPLLSFLLSLHLLHDLAFLQGGNLNRHTFFDNVPIPNNSNRTQLDSPRPPSEQAPYHSIFFKTMQGHPGNAGGGSMPPGGGMYNFKPLSTPQQLSQQGGAPTGLPHPGSGMSAGQVRRASLPSPPLRSCPARRPRLTSLTRRHRVCPCQTAAAHHPASASARMANSCALPLLRCVSCVSCVRVCRVSCVVCVVCVVCACARTQSFSSFLACFRWGLVALLSTRNSYRASFVCLPSHPEPFVSLASLLVLCVVCVLPE